MVRIYAAIALLTLFFFSYESKCQTLPVGSDGLEEYYRLKQLLGELDSTVSFSIRPLFPLQAFKIKNIYDPDSILKVNNKSNASLSFARSNGVIQVLPLSWQQQYNARNPYSWNDGSFIPARGYQTILSGGIFAKYGPLSIQVRPEFLYVQNRKFEGFVTNRSDQELTSYYNYYNLIDNPEIRNNGSYSKVLWGQSSIRLTVGPMSIGLSNENLWWGPGVNNALIMTNNANGFKHLTLNTIRPIQTPYGSFEMQIIAGKLENSNLKPLLQTTTSLGANLFQPYNDDWRYLTGFNISYQPKWLPGLSVGFIRDFVSYKSDVNRFKDYFPFFFPVQKATTGVEGDPFDRDQRISMYTRWLFQKAKAEVYFEYGLNDNSYNYRDFLGSPEHSRAYIFGITKLVQLPSRENEWIKINAEIDQLSQSPDYLIRPSGGFYQHYQVRQGYTNLGDVLGAGTGDGGNLQSLNVSWVKGLKQFGFMFQRLEHNADFYNSSINDLNGYSRRWVDFGLGIKGNWDYKNFIFNFKIEGIKSLNYQWIMKDYVANENYIPHNDAMNLHCEIGTVFRF